MIEPIEIAKRLTADRIGSAELEALKEIIRLRRALWSIACGNELKTNIEMCDFALLVLKGEEPKYYIPSHGYKVQGLV